MGNPYFYLREVLNVGLLLMVDYFNSVLIVLLPDGAEYFFHQSLKVLIELWIAERASQFCDIIVI